MEFIAFIKNYWQFIAVGVLALLELISIIAKRRPKTVDEFDDCVHQVINQVARWVYLSEKEYYNLSGSQRKQDVIDVALKTCSYNLGRALTSKEAAFVSEAVSNQIESIMLAPTKKGGCGREKAI